MHHKSISFIFLLLAISATSLAQSSFATGLLPKVRISAKISDQIKWVQGIESRQAITDNSLENSFNYDYILTDISSIISFKIGSNTSTNIGYLVRFREGKTIHRAIQQFNIVTNADAYRIGHRFATDQTFGNETTPTFRLRYRVTAEKPLSGSKVDPKEFYAKLGNEYLGSLKSNNGDLEIRLLPFIGYEISKTNKVEIGLDYRISKFIDGDSKNNLWLSFNWFYSLDLRSKKQ